MVLWQSYVVPCCVVVHFRFYGVQHDSQPAVFQSKDCLGCLETGVLVVGGQRGAGRRTGHLRFWCIAMFLLFFLLRPWQRVGYLLFVHWFIWRRLRPVSSLWEFRLIKHSIQELNPLWRTLFYLWSNEVITACCWPEYISLLINQGRHSIINTCDYV